MGLKRRIAGLLGPVMAAGLVFTAAQAQTPPEPGIAPGISLTNISKNGAKFASVFAQVSVSRADPKIVAVAWRRYNLPIDTNALRKDRIAECHLALSRDGGAHFTDRNMMDVLRTPGGDGRPLLWGCNAPWVTIAADGTMYFGGALFTAGGVLQTEPKAGRAGVSVSTDGGRHWSKVVPGIMIDRFMPGMTGLGGGLKQEDTPWDGANGFADPQTGTFYSTAGAYISASDDKAKSFGTVYQGKGTASAAFGQVVAARSVASWPNAQCPCLVASTTPDKGKTWTEKLVSDASGWNNSGTVRYPIAAADPSHPGGFAIAAYQPDHRNVKLFYTSDGGANWKSAAPGPVPANIAISSVNQVGVGYASDGRILLTWRGFRNPGAFNSFAAMFSGGNFGPTVKLSPELSEYPALTYAGNYGNGNGGGDFTTWVTGNDKDAFIAFPYAPGGVVLDTWLARVPLKLLQ